ncbi:MAG: TAT-variant-translocated molybdopterin oxidoreductase [Chloroflexaceae bacterium]|jgi:molybdopterin-containing oxidoreductase family iron-sulfur binding subunit|nr:TAT-variant-translocated molybdopterin oxidoreductase [Chloroflexaceae bacterium]
MSKTEQPLDLAAIRARLADSHGRHFWRSLDEIAGTPAFQTFVEREFPQGAAELTDPVSRRNFLKLMGASLALAGLAGCTIPPPQQKVAPYAQAPTNQLPGVPLYYTTVLPQSGYGLGVVVTSHEGRPTKIEGNLNHPASLGATDVFAQADLLTMYDPDRSQSVLNNGGISTWDKFLALLPTILGVQRTVEGAGMRLLTGSITSPSLINQINGLLAAFPQMQWVQYEPVNHDNSYNGARQAFGEPVETRYRLSDASVIVTLDADLFGSGPGRVRYARDFADGRRVGKASTEMNRLYAIESTPSTTGLSADHRLPLKAGQIEAAARFLAAQVGVANVATAEGELPGEEFLTAVAADLVENRGRCVVIAGDGQPPIVHALAHAINGQLGNVGTTVEYTEPIVAGGPDQTGAMRQLVADMQADQVEVLIMSGVNPVYDAPADLGFREALQRVRFRLHHGLYDDETGQGATWHIPASHTLESWSDLRAYDGTVSIVQPLILPLYQSKTLHEVLAAFTDQTDQSNYDLVREFWQGRYGQPDGVPQSNNLSFDNFWGESLQNGVLAGTAAAPRMVTFRPESISAAPTAAVEGLELIFRPDPTLYDGFYANNGWLQELPKPLTTVTWDNPALVAPATAQRLGLSNEDVVELQYSGGILRAPVWITPGHPVDAVTITLGYGRSRTGRVGTGTGINAYLLRTSSAPWFASGLAINRTGDKYMLATVQDHWDLGERDIVRTGVFEEYKKDPKYIAKEVYKEEYGKEEPGPGTDGYVSLLPTEIPGYEYKQHAWGMAIDLTTCIGCGACAIACQAENNIPIVGKDEVKRGREMHWIRVDRYYEGQDLDNPTTYVQPLTCMQCEKAPCEIVCPVAATVHDHEGINNMVYNRCVGTKYCSNNCPYKVRRFNFLQYSDTETIQLTLMRNPEVTVRNRGVMEKCTYCVQRISHARIESKKAENNGTGPFQIADGAVKTACQQVCPTQAISFGDTKDPNSAVYKMKAEGHHYTLLNFLNTVPRTGYMARIRNPNPALETHGGEAKG